jgi:hypothetical protein
LRRRNRPATVPTAEIVDEAAEGWKLQAKKIISVIFAEGKKKMFCDAS